MIFILSLLLLSAAAAPFNFKKLIATTFAGTALTTTNQQHTNNLFPEWIPAHIASPSEKPTQALPNFDGTSSILPHPNTPTIHHYPLPIFRSSMSRKEYNTFMLIQKHCNNNEAWAQFHMATFFDSMYPNLNIIRKNDHEAFRLYLLSANQGYAKAQHSVAYHYHNKDVGNNEISIEKAIYWYSLAAAQSYSPSMRNLAVLIDENHVPGETDHDCFLLMEKVATMGDSDAQNFLGIYYNEGTGVTVDLVKSRFWFTKAALQGNLKAQYNLASSIKKTGNNLASVLYWLRKSAEGGYDAAMDLLKDVELEISSKCSKEMQDDRRCSSLQSLLLLQQGLSDEVLEGEEH